MLRAFDDCAFAKSFSSLQLDTGIVDCEVLKRLLHSLSCQKYKVNNPLLPYLALPHLTLSYHTLLHTSTEKRTSIHPSIYLFIHPSIYPFIHPSTIHLFIDPSNYTSIHLFIHTYIPDIISLVSLSMSLNFAKT